jgi:SAM-dependent methyltransferase
MSAREVWTKDTAFSERKVDFANSPFFAPATDQIRELTAQRPVERIVEVGSGSGRYLAYLAHTTGLPVIGSDIGSPRLQMAREEHPHIHFEEADAGEMARRYNSPGTLFLAMNVLGNLDPTELLMFVDGVSMLTFCARGRLTGDSQPRENGVGWDHNYTDLLKGFTLLQLEATPSPKFPGREAIIATAYR